MSPGSMPRPTTMNFSEAVAVSASSLWAHKLRSVLTLIGVVIGVAAVIAVVSLIQKYCRGQQPCLSAPACERKARSNSGKKSFWPLIL